MKIFVDPEDDIQYMSFYIKGLYDRFGQENVIFDHHIFQDLPYSERITRTMRFIVKTGITERHYTIDTKDSYSVNETLYAWSDTYGSVNANFSKTPESLREKLISLCPSFAIRYTNIGDACLQVTKGILSTDRNKRKYLGSWKRTMQRPSLRDYVHCQPKENYIFHLSTLWQSDEWNRNDQGVNLRRAEFIRACRTLQPSLIFEGGLTTSRNDDSSLVFADCITSRLSSTKCLKKTKDSFIVFNTPAYWNCHGWKLGEYMALGKAILSTPLSNDLPAPLIHGKHIHFVEDTQESMKEEISFLLHHPNYCAQLEHAILSYWQKYGTPEASLKLLGL